MWRAWIVSVLVTIATVLPCRSDDRDPSPAKLGLSECLHAALKTGPQRALIAADLSMAQARLDLARASRFGEAYYTQIAGFVNEARGNAVSSPNDQTDFFDGLGPFTRLDLDIRIPIYTFGKLSAALEAAEKGLLSERARGEAARAETILETKRLYYGLLLSQQLTYVLDDMLENMDEAIEKTAKRLDDGSQSVTELDVLRLKIGRAKFAAGVEEVHASTRLTQSALARAIGRKPGSAVVLSETRLRPAEFELEALEAYAGGGASARPEWRQITSGLEAQEAVVKLEEASSYPTVFLATGVRYAYADNRDDQRNQFVRDDFNYFEPVGVLGLRWDLNFFSSSARVAKARAARDRLVAEQQQAESGLRLEVERAHVDVSRSKATIVAAYAGRKAARGLLVLTVSNFDLGLGSAEDLFEAYVSYTESSTDYFRAVHDFNLAVAELSRAVGRELLDLDY